MAQLRYTLLLCVCAAGLLLPAALADDASAAVEAAAARGEAVVLAAPGGGEVAAAAAGAAAEPINEGGFAAFSVGAIVRAADLAALARGNVSRVPFTAGAFSETNFAASYTNDGTNKTSSITIRGIQTVNFDSVNPASTYEDPGARLLGLSGASGSSADVLQPGATVTYLGRLGVFEGLAQRVDTTFAALGWPPVQPVVFPADNTACQYLINTVDADCGVFFDGRARSDITFNSALPPPLDKPLLSGGPLADYDLGPTNVAKQLSCVLDDPSKFITAGSDCAAIFPPTASAAATSNNDDEAFASSSSSSSNAAVNKLLGAARGARPAPPKDAREQWQQSLERLPAPFNDVLRGTAGATPDFFFGGGGGSLPPNVNVTNSWGGSIGVSVKEDDLRALLNGSASSAATLGYPWASISGDFFLADQGSTRSVQAIAGIAANLPGSSVAPLKAKIFGAGGGLPLIGGGNPLKPPKVVSYAGLVTPYFGLVQEDDGAFLEKIPVAFQPGAFCAYTVLGINDAGQFACFAQFPGVTPSAPTFPTLLANGEGDVPLAPTAFSNFALRPTSLPSFSCELTDPSKPIVIECDA